MVAPIRVLCVAEKNDAAKNIAKMLSKNNFFRRDGQSKYNKLYCFEGDVLGSRANISKFYTLNLYFSKLVISVFTSVSGHLSEIDFGDAYRKWEENSIGALFTAPVIRRIPENMKEVERTLRSESKISKILIIWTDCDREGENIGAEIASVCKMQNPRIDVYRARFSEITLRSVSRAMNNLVRIDDNSVNAVDCRSELDLRIGASFTRLQTLHLRRHFSNILGGIISYGSCQFPTLGFVVERYKAIQSFVPEQFWQLIGKDVGNKIDFSWERNRLFDEEVTKAFYDLCLDEKQAKVVVMDKHPKLKWRPNPLDTILLERLGIQKLRMTAREVMNAAEKLYTKGYISYPRTETNKYPHGFHLRELVDAQSASFYWGDFATEILNGEPNPRNGQKSDEAHPPIHPIKFANKENMPPNEWMVYELVVRHFLACVSRNAKGQETKVQVVVAGELFNATGLIVEDLGYLKVWTYEKWADKQMPAYQVGQVIPNFVVNISTGKTEPPVLLNEADLIALMDKYGIGTDATHADHIEKIKERKYVALNRDKRFVPGYLGLALVDAYNEMGYEMSKPMMRAELEAQLVAICNGTRTKDDVLKEQLKKYKTIFDCTEDKKIMLSNAFRRYQEAALNNNN